MRSLYHTIPCRIDLFWYEILEALYSAEFKFRLQILEDISVLWDIKENILILKLKMFLVQ